MNKEKIRRIHAIYSLFTGIVSFLAAICLMAACINIYFAGGDQPYTHQSVAENFQPIAPVVYGCLALVIGGFLLNALLPSEKKPGKPQKDHAFLLDVYSQKADMSACKEDLAQQIARQRKLRKLHQSICSGVLVLCAAVFLIYACDPGHYHQHQINASMIRAMWVLLPCLAIGFGYAVFVSFFCSASIQKEITLLKQLPSKKGAVSAAAKDYKSVELAQVGIFVVAAVMLILGLLDGGALDVLTKAVNICTECIGLG